jgi:hypothetical protein
MRAQRVVHRAEQKNSGNDSDVANATASLRRTLHDPHTSNETRDDLV